MALVNFKKGVLSQLPSAYAEGTFYVTTDERAIYLDISGTERIRLGDFQTVANLSALDSIPQAKRSESALYYVENINCLAKWDADGGDSGAGAWVQINPDTGAIGLEIADSNANGFTASYSAETRKITLTISKKFVDENTLNTKIGDIGSKSVKDYVDEKTSGIASDEALKSLGERVTTAEGKLDTIQGEAEGSIKKALKDAKDYADGLDSAMDTRVEALEETAEALDETYAPIEHEHDIEDIDGLQDALDEKADDSDLEDAKSRISTLESQIGGLSGAMHFKGTVNEDPATMQDVSSYVEGDVVVFGNKEYVFNGTSFVEFGDVTAEGQRITALEGKLNGITDTVKKYVDDQDSAMETKLVGTGDATSTTIKGAVEEAEDYTDDAIAEITNGDAINDFAGVEDALDDIQNGTSINDFAGVETALTWGSF